MTLQALIDQIHSLDMPALAAARRRQDDLTKPRGSLGRLEELSCRVSGMMAQMPPLIRDKAVIVMAGDHGVVAEGVSAYPSDVTAQMVANFLQGGAAINVLARHTGTRVVVVDMGVATDLQPKTEGFILPEEQAGLVIKKIARGTGNIARRAGMTRQQAIDSILAGVAVAESQIENEVDILATGDMGIGNTTPSAAIAAALTGYPAHKFIGRGAGLDDAGLNRKLSAVERALAVNQPNPMDGIDVLAKVGGFEIGGLTGVILAAAARRKPVVIDGFISTAAALLAASLAPASCDYMIAAHRSQEQGHNLMLEWLKLEPLLDLGMRLGEGTGAVLAMSLVEAACKILAEMATFHGAGVSDKL
jgi:nicotinate-nucleotide--dimethylbenzimidazole phosphoribosyltransferase